MDARVENRNGVFVVNITGQLDFESADLLKARCLELFNDKNLIFNLRGLTFVGSSGLTPFLDLIGELSRMNGPKFKICSVSSDFLRLFETGNGEGIEVYRDITDAERAYFASEAEITVISRIKPFGLKISID